MDDITIKCPYCGREDRYIDSVIDYYTQKSGFDNCIHEMELMKCTECGKTYYSSWVYRFERLESIRKESELDNSV